MQITLVSVMDRATIEQHLAQAEDHVRMGAEHIASQRAIVADLQAKDQDATEALRLLNTFEEMQVMHVTDRDRILTELAAMD